VVDVDGATGIGFCYAGSDAGSIPATAVRDLFAPLVAGRISHQTVGLWDEMYRLALLHGRTGSVMRALSAVDIALWDLNSRLAGLPLAHLLGADRIESVNAYASGGYYREGKGVPGLVAEIESYVAAGFDAVKIKVGRSSVAEDAERIAAVRAVLGPDRLLMLDANNAWRDLADAVRAMRAWERYDPYWIEEPFSPDDLVNHSRLAERTPVMVATGEIEAGRWRHLELLRSSAAAILQSDAGVCGGITEFMRIAHLADAFGVPMAPHWFHDLHVHLVAAIGNGAWVEYFPGDDVFNFRALIDRQLEVLPGGMVAVPTALGLGFGFSDDIVDRHAVDGWS
jgi:L-alanine-DL-glutamate epimerase-like enolase superfamily enzyme